MNSNDDLRRWAMVQSIRGLSGSRGAQAKGRP
jgi:hypothetical protein